MLGFTSRSPTVWGRSIGGLIKWAGLMLLWYAVLLTVVLGIISMLPADTLAGIPGNVVGGVLFVVWFAWGMTGHFQRTMARLTRPLRRHFQMAGFGRGGSARFAGMLEEWDTPYKPGSILLGQSLFDDDLIGSDDDRGLLTVASNRSGKGRSAIIPNLLLWPGSAVVIDPKGTNAAVTAARRGHGGGRVKEGMGQDVHVVDPFGIVPDVTSACFNPLASLDLNALTAKEDVGLLADALIVPGQGADSHFDESARDIVAGVIVQLLSENPNATLLDVREALTQNADGLDDLFGRLMNNTSVRTLTRGAAALADNAGDRERGSMMTTVLRNTGWLDSRAMAGILGSSSFDIADVKRKPTTIYVVLPPHLLTEHSRFMRLFVNLTVRAAAQGGKSRIPILLIMDEFFSLGTLSSLAKASGALAGFGLKLWPIVQNLTQLLELYPQNWQTFFANAGVVSLFAVNDRATAEEIMRRLGKSTWHEGDVRVVSDLVEATELELLTERDGGLQVVLPSGKRPMLLAKCLYDKHSKFHRTNRKLDQMLGVSRYNPDPDHPGS